MGGDKNWALAINPIMEQLKRLKGQYQKLLGDNQAMLAILRGEGKSYDYYVLDEEQFAYYNELSDIPREELFAFLNNRKQIGKKMTLEASNYVNELETACRELKLIYEENSACYQEYQAREQERQQQEWMQAAKQKRYEEDASIPFKVKLEDAMQRLFEYAGIEPEKAEILQNGWELYQQSLESNIDEDVLRKSLRSLDEVFYEVYEKVFLRAQEEENSEPLINFFLCFGLMDETIFTEEELAVLGKCITSLERKKGKYHMYTMRQWLQKIYKGEKEPSKNEFDMDYRDVYLDMKKTQRFTAAQEAAYFSDYAGKVRFEIKNMFRRCCRQLSGQMGMFCPILHSAQMPRGLEASFLSPELLEEKMEAIRSIDFSIFYRENLYQNNEKKIDKALIQVEILPDIILMPIFGTRGVMWQDIEGKRRLSAGRFMLPAFFQGDLDGTLLKMAGKFRWELCRTIQGGYWNNISEKSLTSEYYDYLQFFKKNRELNDQVRQKIKDKMKSFRNNFSEMFIYDYCQWIKFESHGANKLNKVSRAIFSSYCPFSRKYREELSNNPVFSDLLMIWERKQEGRLKAAANQINRLMKDGASMTKELEDTLAFYRM